jgi:lysozyme
MTATTAARSRARIGVALLALAAPGCLGGDAGVERTAQAIHQSCAAHTDVRGIDVSQWQGTIRWERLPAAGVRFAIIRLSNGMSPDTRFAENWAGAASAGVLRGAYHYFNATQGGTAQANYFIDQLLARGFGDGDLPPMLDVEYTNVDSNGDGTNDRPSVTPAVYQARLREWIDTVRARLGRDPIIYTGGYYWDSWVQSGEWASLPLFHAEYPNYSTRRSWSDPVPNAGCARYVSNQWPRYSFWQYAGDNTVASTLGGAGTFGSTAVDMDVFDGTLDELRALARVTPPIDARYVDQSTDAAGEVDGSGAQFHVCAGQAVRVTFELENTGGVAWTDTAAPGAVAGGAVRLGAVPHDTADPLTGEARISLNRASNRRVVPAPAGGDCSDHDGCRRTVFTMTGRAPTAAGEVRTRWQLVDELRAWFGPEVWLSFHVAACPVDAGVMPPVDVGVMAPVDAGAMAPVDVAVMAPVDVGVVAPADVGAAERDAGEIVDVAEIDDEEDVPTGESDEVGEGDRTLYGRCRAAPGRPRGAAGWWALGLLGARLRRRRRVATG